MHLDEADSAAFKNWIIKKLEDISDADSEVLADYVLALVTTDGAEATAKANCTEQLKDFLADNAEKFVDEAFAAIAAKAFDPSRPPPPVKPTAAIYAPPRRASFEPPGQLNGSRKRSYHDWDIDAQQNITIQAYDGGERPMKQRRRGGRGGYEARGGRLSQTPMRQYGAPGYQAQTPQQMQLPQMPTPPPGMPPFDPNNPLAALLAMQQIMGLPMPDMSSIGPPLGMAGLNNPRTGQRCRDYDNKGFCARGVACPYEHGENPLVVPQQTAEYDPNNATMINVTPTHTGYIDVFASDRGRGRGRGRGGGGGSSRGGGKRADFSHTGPNNNRSITSIVVEQIPEDNFDEQTVRDFFAEFGNIEEVTMQPYKRLAVVKYDDYDAANAAYNSPKSVFDNRFVKVYWYRPETLPRPTNGHAGSPTTARQSADVEMQQTVPDFDPEEVAKRQEEAQRKHEEAQKQREEALKQKAELDEKLKLMERERKKMAELLAKKSGKVVAPPAGSPPTANGGESEQTKALKAQLAKLEAEAKSLGIDPDAPATNSWSSSPYGRGRGGFRGRGSRGRGQYQPPSRGGWPARGGRTTMSLDNRPKTVAITFQEGSYEQHEEALRQYLMFNGLETAVMSKHPSTDGTALVAFQQRYEGENLMEAAAGTGPLAQSELSKHLGNIELTWYAPSVENVPKGATNGHHEGNGLLEHGDAAAPVGRNEVHHESKDMDTYDEADDDMDRYDG